VNKTNDLRDNRKRQDTSPKETRKQLGKHLMSGFNFVNKSSNQSDISKKLGNHFTSSSNTPFKNASINTKKNAQNSMLEKDLLPQKNLTETKNEFMNFSSS
jgi:hypothetical protein